MGLSGVLWGRCCRDSERVDTVIARLTILAIFPKLSVLSSMPWGAVAIVIPYKKENIGSLLIPDSCESESETKELSTEDFSVRALVVWPHSKGQLLPEVRRAHFVMGSYLKSSV